MIDTTAASIGSAAPALAVDELWRSFGARAALRGASLEVYPGEIHALLGPNGAGKTTLLRILVGLVDPDAGEVSMLGQRGTTLAAPSSRTLFGFVPATDRTFYERISGLENLVFFGRLHGLTRKGARSRGLECLERVALEEAAFVPVGEYSHGMKKRLATARALLMSPSVLLMDEATHDLDPEGARRVRRLIVDEAARGTAVLWTTQRVEEIRGFADRVTVLHQGSVRFVGTVSHLVTKGGQRWMIELDGGDAAKAVQALDEVGLTHIETDIREATRFLLALPPGGTVGAALLALAEAGVGVANCWQESSEIEDAFLALTQEREG